MRSIRAISHKTHASRRLLVAALAIVAGLSAPQSIMGQCGCTGCLELCRQTFGGLRGVDGKIMVLSECFVKEGSTYCVYTQWGA